MEIRRLEKQVAYTYNTSTSIGELSNSDKLRDSNPL